MADMRVPGSPTRRGKAAAAIRFMLLLALCGLLIRMPVVTSPAGAEETTCVLTMTVDGDGEVTPAAGQHSFPSGEVVDIAATPAEGWQFDNWTGVVADPSANVTTISMTDNQTVTASFSQVEIEPETFTLTMEVAGEGEVTPAAGQHSFPSGEVVDITATPAEGWQFDSWTGEVADPGANVTTISMTDNQTVTASFSQVEIEPVAFTLTMAVAGEGEVTPAAGQHSFPSGEVVDITATPAEGWQFDNWAGEVADPSANVTTISMNDNQTVTASFSPVEIEPETFTLTMAVDGDGVVTPAAGQHSFPSSEVVDITATPAEGWQFDNWTGEVADPSANVTTISMNDNQTVTASFSQVDTAAPVVMCGWEQEPVADLESGDLPHLLPGSQILPPLAWGATQPVDYYLVVTGPEDDSVDRVFSYVYYPAESPPSYGDDYDPEGLKAGYKCRIAFTRVEDQAAAADLVAAAGTAGLITLSPGWGLEDLTGAAGAVTRGAAALWRGRASLAFDDPAGDYAVRARAVDSAGNESAWFETAFNYVPVSGVEVDFTGIEYGSVLLGVEGVQAGDSAWGDGLAGDGWANKATIRNIGNTWAHVTIEQQDMGFGTVGGEPGTALVSSSPLGAASNWNVSFGVCLGDEDASRVYFDPNALAITPNWLELSATLEIEFSILVRSGSGTHGGEMTIGSRIEPFNESGLPGSS